MKASDDESKIRAFDKPNFILFNALLFPKQLVWAIKRTSFISWLKADWVRRKYLPECKRLVIDAILLKFRGPVLGLRNNNKMTHTRRIAISRQVVKTTHEGVTANQKI